MIAWAKTVYVEKDGVWEREKWAGWNIPTVGLVPYAEGSLQRVARALKCNNIKAAPLEPTLEYLISSSIKIEMDDDGGLLVKPLLRLLSSKS